MPVNAEIRATHPGDTTALGGNVIYTGVEWQPRYKAESHIYLYNVSARTFSRVGPYQNVNIPGVTDDDPVLQGMKSNERYHFVAEYPQPVLLPVFNDASGEIEVKRTDARRLVMDIINPNNLTYSLDTVIKPEQVFSVGTDLSQSGVFFSESKPPKKEEVAKAYARMEARYRGLLEKARTLELTDKAQLQTELGSNPDYAYAAEYFGAEVSWRKRQVRPEQCAECGDFKPAGVPFHVNSQLHFVCVTPTVDGWKAAVRAGVKRREDVPEEFRYWETEAK